MLSLEYTIFRKISAALAMALVYISKDYILNFFSPMQYGRLNFCLLVYQAGALPLSYISTS